MRRKSRLIGLVLAAVVGSDCNCSDSLGLAIGEVELSLCDRGEACGCSLMSTEGSSIDFGSPAAGETSSRVLTIRNTNQPRKLTVQAITIAGGGDLFAVTSVQKRASEAADAASETHDLLQSPLVLEDTELAEVY